jgi:hypothetical protein
MPRIAGVSTPKYRKHRATGQAVVTIAGKDHYLGPWKSKASQVEHDRLIMEWLAAGRPTSLPVHIEVWLEKDALAGVIYEETEKWAVPLLVSKGFSSLSYCSGFAPGKPIETPTHKV